MDLDAADDYPFNNDRIITDKFKKELIEGNYLSLSTSVLFSRSHFDWMIANFNADKLYRLIDYYTNDTDITEKMWKRPVHLIFEAARKRGIDLFSCKSFSYYLYAYTEQGDDTYYNLIGLFLAEGLDPNIMMGSSSDSELVPFIVHALQRKDSRLIDMIISARGFKPSKEVFDELDKQSHFIDEIREKIREN